jgi:hypothetical protein
MAEQTSRGGIRVDISPGELSDRAKLVNVRHEYDVPMEVHAREIVKSGALRELTERLKSINAVLWEIEDHIREHERAKSFDADFVTLVRSVSCTNDKRSAAKGAFTNRSPARSLKERARRPIERAMMISFDHNRQPNGERNKI